MANVRTTTFEPNSKQRYDFSTKTLDELKHDFPGYGRVYFKIFRVIDRRQDGELLCKCYGIEEPLWLSVQQARMMEHMHWFVADPVAEFAAKAVQQNLDGMRFGADSRGDSSANSTEIDGENENSNDPDPLGSYLKRRVEYLTSLPLVSENRSSLTPDRFAKASKSPRVTPALNEVVFDDNRHADGQVKREKPVKLKMNERTRVNGHNNPKTTSVPREGCAKEDDEQSLDESIEFLGEVKKTPEGGSRKSSKDCVYVDASAEVTASRKRRQAEKSNMVPSKMVKSDVGQKTQKRTLNTAETPDKKGTVENTVKTEETAATKEGSEGSTAVVESADNVAKANEDARKSGDVDGQQPSVSAERVDAGSNDGLEPEEEWSDCPLGVNAMNKVGGTSRPHNSSRSTDRNSGTDCANRPVDANANVDAQGGVNSVDEKTVRNPMEAVVNKVDKTANQDGTHSIDTVNGIGEKDVVNTMKLKDNVEVSDNVDSVEDEDKMNRVEDNVDRMENMNKVDDMDTVHDVDKAVKMEDMDAMEGNSDTSDAEEHMNLVKTEEEEGSSGTPGQAAPRVRGRPRQAPQPQTPGVEKRRPGRPRKHPPASQPPAAEPKVPKKRGRKPGSRTAPRPPHPAARPGPSARNAKSMSPPKPLRTPQGSASGLSSTSLRRRQRDRA